MGRKNVARDGEKWGVTLKYRLKKDEACEKGWSKGGDGRRMESAKRQRGQIPRDSVLSSGAASTPGTRKSGEGVNGGCKGMVGSGWWMEGEEGELISSTHAHWVAPLVSRDSPVIPHNIPSRPAPLACSLLCPSHHPSIHLLPHPWAPSLPPCPVPPAPLGSLTSYGCTSYRTF